MMRAGIAPVWARRRLRIALLGTLLALPLLGGGWLWLRHSSLVAVEHVQVRGLLTVHGADTGAIDAALTDAARGMSTLDVRTSALRAAVASYPIVRSVRARANFPHGLRIEVLERPPVAALVIDGVRTAVAADGVVLGPGFLTGSLPLVSAGRGAPAGASSADPATANNASPPTASSASSPTASNASPATANNTNPTGASSANPATATLPARGQTVRGASLLDALEVLGAAPAPLASAVVRAYSGTKGLTLVLRGNLLAYFGDATRARAKWIALARVLADPSSVGAAYVDVRLPERPAAGFAPGTARPYAGTGETEPPSTSDSATAAELAAGLDAAVGGGASSPGASPGAAGQTERAGTERPGAERSRTEQSGTEQPGTEQPGSAPSTGAGTQGTSEPEGSG